MSDIVRILIGVGLFAVLGALLGLAIGFFSKIFYVEDDPRVEHVLSLLPGANCGGCGHPGCAGMAEAIVFDGEDPRKCNPNKQEKVDEIKLYLDEYNKLHAK